MSAQEGTASCSHLYGFTSHSKQFTNTLSRLEIDACIITGNKISVFTKTIEMLGDGAILLIETFDQSALLLVKDWNDFHFNCGDTFE